MIYEVREYVAVPGRMPAIIKLFREVTLPLFDKHDMEVVSVGRTSLGDHSFNELVYVLQFSDLTELDAKWSSFLADADWAAALSSYEADGPLHQSIRRRVVDPSPFSEM
ncbi:NIPSNAP family protein [Pseudonocardia ammonioxydans]|uniref:NIPSNAP family protein n=1 Tax=Pseudonocardia ammonioxydans TaxID=260086 RepID=UPI000B895B46|nr:NIPSNAP family protein [Pseudonocardia ammonioxydans]